MTTFRSNVLASVAALAVALWALAPLAATAADGAPVPVVTMRGSISPSRRLVPGTPLSFRLDTLFATRPPGADLVLQRLDYLFPHGTVVNGRLFPSCTVATIDRAHGRLSACPPGSKIGGGVATGTAVELGVTADAVVTLFNGPGGRSITMNATITTPARIDVTFSAPFVTLHGGHWANRLSIVLPDSLRSVLGGDVTTSKIDVTTGATRVVHGVRRGYIEAQLCPANGKARIHGDFAFSQGAAASADTTVVC
jgi:hypothetical protein